MPELPEVETIKRSLQKDIVGKTITNIEVRKLKLFQGDVKEVIGKKILSVNRAGKMLIIDLEGDYSLLIHNKMSGQLVWSNSLEDKVVFGNVIPFAGGNTLPGNTTHIIIKTDGGTLFFNDLRQFGWIKVIKDIKNLQELKELGPEPFDFAQDEPFINKEFTVEYLQKTFSKTSKPIKVVLLEQQKIAGVGNIYDNDALFEAGIMPTRSAKSLSGEEISKLKDGIIKVLKDGIKYGGSSAGDEAYIQPDGTKGKYQEHARVYQRDGQSCSRCGTTIKRIAIGGRGTFFCPTCQR